VTGELGVGLVVAIVSAAGFVVSFQPRAENESSDEQFTCEERVRQR